MTKLISPKETSYKHYEHLYKEGGLLLKVKSSPGFMDSMGKIFKDIAAKIMKGNFNLMELNMPAATLGNFTRLEMIAHDFEAMVTYVEAASEISDPLERVKLVVGGHMAASSYSINCTKCSAPIPVPKGEKLEGVSPAGHRIIITHISDKQDKSEVKVVGKDEAFTIDALWEGSVKIRGMNPGCLSGKGLHPVIIKFKDGQTISLQPSGL